MFKSFDAMNQRLTEVQLGDYYRADAINMDAEKILTTAKNISQQYARDYSQVQWMKYDENGNPEDVTPDMQSSVPDSVLAAAKQTVNEARDHAESFSMGTQTVSVTRKLGMHTLGLYISDTVDLSPKSGWLYTGSHLMNIDMQSAKTINYYLGTGTPQGPVATIRKCRYISYGVILGDDAEISVFILRDSDDNNNPMFVVELARQNPSDIMHADVFMKGQGGAWFKFSRDVLTDYIGGDMDSFTLFQYLLRTMSDMVLPGTYPVQPTQLGANQRLFASSDIPSVERWYIVSAVDNPVQDTVSLAAYDLETARPGITNLITAINDL